MTAGRYSRAGRSPGAAPCPRSPRSGAWTRRRNRSRSRRRLRKPGAPRPGAEGNSRARTPRRPERCYAPSGRKRGSQL